MLPSLANSNLFPLLACFAIIKLGGEVVRDELDVLTETCSFLCDVGLVPALVHGGGPQMNSELLKRGVEPKYIRGNRVTDEKTLEVGVLFLF
jgi:acetylglutamate kinase